MAFDELRRPLFLIALGAAVLVALIELGSAARAVIHVGAVATPGVPDARPGYGIAYLICIDGLLVYSLGLMAASLFLSREFTGRVQGIIGIVVSVLGLLALVLMFLFAFQLLILMVSLLLAPPFGTIAYFALFSYFDRSAAAATLGCLVLLKVGVAMLLLLAQQRFLANKSLVLLVALSLGCTLLVSFLQAFPPGFLVSITDALAAVIVAVIGIVWAIFLLGGSVVATVKAVV